MMLHDSSTVGNTSCESRNENDISSGAIKQDAHSIMFEKKVLNSADYVTG